MRRRTALRALCGGVTVAGLIGGGLMLAGAPGRSAESDQGFLANLVSRALSTSATQVHIGGVDGALSSDATIRDVEISDRDGVWLKLDRARLIWRRSALLLRRLEIDRLEIGHLEIRRRPLASPSPAKDADQPVLPDLPVKVQVKTFALANLDLGAPILGTAMRATATGDAELGSPAEGLVFDLDGKRLDSPGALAIALHYVPQGNALDMRFDLDEPAHGLMSKIGHIPDEPPVVFHLAGKGTLDAFAARLDFRAGPEIDAEGTIDLRRRDLGRDLDVKIGGRLGALLPSVAASIFEGRTDLTSTVRIDDDGAVSLNEMVLASHLARLDAHGTMSADKVMEFATSIRAVPNAGEMSAAGTASIRKLVFDGTLAGPIASPHIVAKLALRDARLPEGHLGAVDATFTANPDGALTTGTTRIALDADVTASGIAPRDEALAQAIGGSATLDLHGFVDTKGRATFKRIGAKTPTLDIAYAGDLGRERVAGRVTGTAPDLSRFGELAGLKLAGKATLGVDLDGAPKFETMQAKVAADVGDFATGIAPLDRLVGRRVTLNGQVATAPDGAYLIEALKLDGAHLSARASGTASPRAADIRANLVLPDLAAADPSLTGHATLDARLTGSLTKPDLTATAAVDDASAISRPIPHLALAASVADVRGTAATKVTLDGSIDQRPARGTILAARAYTAGKPNGWTLSQFDVAIGSVAIKGAGSYDAAGLANGSLSVAAANLDDLSPLALTRLGGSLSLDASFATPEGRQNVSLAGKGVDLRAAGAAIRRFGLTAEARDLYAHPVLDADASIDQALIASQTISNVTFSAKGATTQSAIKLSARAAGFDLDAAGALIPGPATRFNLASFSARREGRKIALAGPADLIMGPSGNVDIKHFALDVAGGRLTAQGQAGKTLDLAVEARAIPLSAVGIVKPGLGLGGTLDATARIQGTPSAPTGPYKIDVKRLATPQTKSAAVPPIDILASGRFEGRRVSVNAKVDAGRAGSVTATGTAPLDAAGSLDLALRGKLDAAAANAKLGTAGRTVSGAVLVDAKLTGSTTFPKVDGSVTMRGGTFRDSLLGVRVDAIDARLVAKGDRVSIDHCDATTPGDGRLTASGNVQIDPAADFPGSIKLHGHDAQLVSSSLVSATADFGIDISGPLARAPRVAGRLDLTRVDVGIPDRLPSTLKPIDGIRHVNAPAETTARLARVEARNKASSGTKGRAALFDAGLDVTVSAPNRIFLRGRGVDAELGGALHVAGTTNKPMPDGAFDLRRGKIVALGKTLTFTKGKLTFTGDFVPEVDFAAEIQSTDITAQIAITGPAAAPQFAFTSTPDLPQDEILSRILFQKSSGNLSGFQALQLAQAAAQFSSGGDGAFEKLRKSLGVDSLDIGGDAKGPSVGVSRAISDRVSVGVRTGATADQTGLSADVDVTRHIRVQSDVRSNGATSVGVGTELEY